MHEVMRDLIGIVPWITYAKDLILHIQLGIRGGYAYVLHMLSLCEDLLEKRQVQLISEVAGRPDKLRKMNRRLVVGQFGHDSSSGSAMSPNCLSHGELITPRRTSTRRSVSH